MQFNLKKFSEQLGADYEFSMDQQRSLIDAMIAGLTLAETPVSVAPALAPGQIWRFGTGVRLIVRTDTGLISVDIRNGLVADRNPQAMVDKASYTYAASSLSEYLTKTEGRL